MELIGGIIIGLILGAVIGFIMAMVGTVGALDRLIKKYAEQNRPYYVDDVPYIFTKTAITRGEPKAEKCSS